MAKYTKKTWGATLQTYARVPEPESLKQEYSELEIKIAEFELNWLGDLLKKERTAIINYFEEYFPNIFILTGNGKFNYNIKIERILFNYAVYIHLKLDTPSLDRATTLASMVKTFLSNYRQQFTVQTVDKRGVSLLLSSNTRRGFLSAYAENWFIADDAINFFD